MVRAVCITARVRTVSSQPSEIYRNAFHWSGIGKCSKSQFLTFRFRSNSKVTLGNSVVRQFSMRVAIITNDFSGFTGSEIVALEAANYFSERGDKVTVRAERRSDALKPYLHPSAEIAEDRIDITKYDIVWSQHGFFCFNVPKLENLKAWKGQFISVHLSGSTPAEIYHHPFASRYALKRVFNCAKAIEMLESKKVVVGKSFNMRNAAPRKFHQAPRSPVRKIKNLLIVSNHLPNELAQVIQVLKSTGIHVRHLGTAGEYRLLQPNDLINSDAVVTIGKTVQYALSSARPVYCYDHFGGPGWLNAENFAVAEWRNFSGRCHQEKKKPNEIVSELLYGFEEAEIFTNKMWPELTKKYNFNTFMDDLLALNGGNLFDSVSCMEEVDMMRGSTLYFSETWRAHYDSIQGIKINQPKGELQRLSYSKRCEVLQARVEILEKALFCAVERPWISLRNYIGSQILRRAARIAKPFSQKRSRKLLRLAEKRSAENYMTLDVNKLNES